MFTLCTNGTCVRAGWCKRFTYYRKLSPQEFKEWRKDYLQCSDEDKWLYYKKNKAREIYERENPDDIFRNDEPIQKEHQDNNREPGLRENNKTYIRVEEALPEWHSAERDSVLQLQCSSDRRSNSTRPLFSTKEAELLDHLIRTHFDRLTRERFDYTRLRPDNQE